MNTQAENIAFDLMRSGVDPEALDRPLTTRSVGPILDALATARGGNPTKPFGCSAMSFIRRVSRDEPTNPECGACNACCRMGYAINKRPGDSNDLKWIKMSDGTERLPMSKGSCDFLADSGCGVYSNRPKACELYDCRTVAVSFAMSSTEDELKNSVFKQWALSSAVRTPDDATALLGLLAVQMLIRGRATEAGVDLEKVARYTIRFYLKYRQELDRHVTPTGSSLPEFLCSIKQLKGVTIGGTTLEKEIDDVMASEQRSNSEKQ